MKKRVLLESDASGVNKRKLIQKAAQVLLQRTTAGYINNSSLYIYNIIATTVYYNNPTNNSNHRNDINQSC